MELKTYLTLLSNVDSGTTEKPQDKGAQLKEKRRNLRRVLLHGPQMPLIQCRGKPLAERSRAGASGANVEEKAKPISAKRERYGTQGARNGCSIYQRAPKILQAFVKPLAA